MWVSDNGTDFTEVASVAVPEAKAGDADGIGRYRMQFPETSARYLKVVAQNAAAIPAWHPGAGSKGFLFVDEVGDIRGVPVRPSGRCPGDRQDG